MWTLRSQATAEAEAFTFRILPGTVKTIGRARGVDFVVDAPLVSRVHCRLTAGGGNRLEVEDLGSTNGTYVNGRRLTAATPLEAGDRLGVGRVELIVERNGDRNQDPT
jgi:pSer/pThr/pTyr-binding forkhead associated (FHA) protein